MTTIPGKDQKGVRSGYYVPCMLLTVSFKRTLKKYCVKGQENVDSECGRFILGRDDRFKAAMENGFGYYI